MSLKETDDGRRLPHDHQASSWRRQLCRRSAWRGTGHRRQRSADRESRQLHVRNGDRVLQPHDQPGPDSPRPVARVRPLQKLARRPAPNLRARHQSVALRLADSLGLAGSRQIRLGVCRPRHGRDETTRHSTHPRPMSLRPAGMDRQLSESGVSTALPRLLRRRRRALSMGSVLYPCQRDLRHVAAVGEGRNMERAGD